MLKQDLGFLADRSSPIYRYEFQPRDFDAAEWGVWEDCPEMHFIFYDEISYYYDPENNDVIHWIQYKYDSFRDQPVTREGFQAALNKAENRADAVIGKMPQNLTLYERYWYLAEALMEMTEYDDHISELLDFLRGRM